MCGYVFNNIYVDVEITNLTQRAEDLLHQNLIRQQEMENFKMVTAIIPPSIVISFIFVILVSTMRRKSSIGKVYFRDFKPIQPTRMVLV